MDMPYPEPPKAAGLEALTRFARQASGADFALAYQAGADGLAQPLAADPGPVPHAFTLARTRFEAQDWSAGPLDAGPLVLPSAVLLTIDRPARQAMFVPTPFAGAPRSGLLLLWAAQSGWRCECPFRSDLQQSVRVLQSAFGEMLASRQDGMRRQVNTDRFHDLFETVPSGIVVLDGDAAAPALVNQRAAALLDMPAERMAAHEVAARMRHLRARCRNLHALETVYADLQTNLDHASTTIWQLGDDSLEVDTHPVLGSGRNGRIWLFHDVTARERLEHELRTRADTDPLTGLANRRRFFEAAAAAIQQAVPHRRGGRRNLALLLLDIDHFKSINDRYGHPAGDAVLRDLAATCRGVLRGTDLMARIGGEEFAVLLPDTSTAEAAGIAERLRTVVAGRRMEAAGHDIAVTVSLGGTGLRSGAETVDALLKRADDCLYEAKRQGRNQVVFDRDES